MLLGKKNAINLKYFLKFFYSREKKKIYPTENFDNYIMNSLLYTSVYDCITAFIYIAIQMNDVSLKNGPKSEIRIYADVKQLCWKIQGAKFGS